LTEVGSVKMCVFMHIYMCAYRRLSAQWSRRLMSVKIVSGMVTSVVFWGLCVSCSGLKRLDDLWWSRSARYDDNSGSRC